MTIYIKEIGSQNAETHRNIHSPTPVFTNSMLGTLLGGGVSHCAVCKLHCAQGWAKTQVFIKNPARSPVGLIGLNRVLMGFMG